MERFPAAEAPGLIRRARQDAGLTQAELAHRAGLRQPSLAQIESGSRNVSAQMLERILRAADYRPSLALADHAAEIGAAAARRGLTHVRVFGSVVRGEDGIDSDIDLLVDAGPGLDLFDLALFGDEVRALTGFEVDVVVDAAESQAAVAARREAVPL